MAGGLARDIATRRCLVGSVAATECLNAAFAERYERYGLTGGTDSASTRVSSAQQANCQMAQLLCESRLNACCTAAWRTSAVASNFAARERFIAIKDRRL
jgi:hypothetical protein